MGGADEKADAHLQAYKPMGGKFEKDDVEKALLPILRSRRLWTPSIILNIGCSGNGWSPAGIPRPALHRPVEKFRLIESWARAVTNPTSRLGCGWRMELESTKLPARLAHLAREEQQQHSRVSGRDAIARGAASAAGCCVNMQVGMRLAWLGVELTSSGGWQTRWCPFAPTVCLRGCLCGRGQQRTTRFRKQVEGGGRRISGAL